MLNWRTLRWIWPLHYAYSPVVHKYRPHVVKVLQYFEAVQRGKQRATKSQMKLFDAAGFAMLTLTTKKISGQFLPVGEEEYAATILNEDGYVVILVDEDGFTKTQSKAVKHDEASVIFSNLKEAGIQSYPGDNIRLWTHTYPTVHHKS